MDERDWLMLKTIAEEKSITRAAERLYISQPAITYRLKAMENEFKCKIVFRTSNGVMLTAQGEFLLSHAREMLLKLTKAKEKVLSIGEKISGPLRIGSSAIFATYKLPDLLRGFLEKYTDVEVFLNTGRSREVSRMLVNEEVSVAIVRGDYPWTEEKFLLREENICLASSKKLEIPELPDKPRIIYGTDSSLQKMVDDWWHETFFRPSYVSMAVDTMDICRRMVKQGLGWAILPDIGMNELDSIYLSDIYWKSGDPVVRRTWLCCHSYSLELPPVRAFISYIKEHIDSIQQKSTRKVP